MLVLENPLTQDHVRSGRTRNEVASVVGMEGGDFVKHSSMPMWILEGAMIGFWNGRKGSSMNIQMLKKLTKITFAASDHGVIVSDGRDENTRVDRLGDWHSSRKTCRGRGCGNENACNGRMCGNRRGWRVS